MSLPERIYVGVDGGLSASMQTISDTIYVRDDLVEVETSKLQSGIDEYAEIANSNAREAIITLERCRCLDAKLKVAVCALKQLQLVESPTVRCHVENVLGELCE